MLLLRHSRSAVASLRGVPNQTQGLCGLCLGRAVHRYRPFSSIGTNDGSVTYLRNGETGAELFLVGTAHVSAKSAEEVRQVIHEVKPNIVSVELCAERARKLMAGEQRQTWDLLRDFISFPGGLGQKLVHIATKSIYSILRNTGVEPGKEFKVAVEEAQRLGAELVYIDQDFRVTVKRIADEITYQDVFKLLTRQADMPAELRREFEKGDFIQGVESLKTRQNIRVIMKGMEEVFPNLVKVLIHERDQLMFNNLRQLEGTIVAVVGMAHMDGIERLWKNK
ncbi:hypothetical protein R1flu_020399 [Riccia fluitans]|uniref:TraB domain-containing protein n=1 Tax=Riccia fluitans TaxID=41844 RepID=A0ABD1ZN26_9MARC